MADEPKGADSYVIALVAIIGSAAVTSGGLVLQKIAHIRAEKAKSEDGSVVPLKDWRFWLGLLMMSVLSVPLDGIAFSKAGQSLVMPISNGVGVVFSQIMGAVLLKEKVTRQNVIAICVIVAGVMVVSIFGSREESVYTVDVLLALFREPATITMFVVAFLGTVGCTICLHVDKLREKLNRVTLLLTAGFVPSVLTGVNFTLFKNVSELGANVANGILVVNQTMVNGTLISQSTRVPDTTTLKSWEIYVFAISAILVAVIAQYYVQVGLKHFSSVKYVPIYQSGMLLFGVIAGGIYFKEFETFHPVFFPIGCLLEIIGIVLLTRTEEGQVVPRALSAARLVDLENKSLTDLELKSINTEEAPCINA